jgi:hypothetical protein
MSDMWNERQAILQRLVPVRGSSPAVCSMDLETLRRQLSLPPLPEHEQLRPGCWIAGGHVVRWLRDEFTGGRGDVDVFFSSLESVQQSLRTMMDGHCEFLGFSSWAERICFRCGVRVKGKAIFGWMRTVRTHLCGACSALTVPGTQPRFEDIVSLTPELVKRSKLVATELRSPDGRKIQLISGHLHPSAERLLLSIDLSICQVAVDATTFYYSQSGLYDLAHDQVAVGHVNYPVITLRRLLRYRRRGFRFARHVWSDLLASRHTARRTAGEPSSL